MNVTLIGLDLAKNIIQVCGVNQAGKLVFNRPVKRTRLLQFLSAYPSVDIAMEACSGSNYWGRTLESLGHRTLLIPPQHVKPFVKGNKNDSNDAFAITEAARRPQMQFVRPRSVEQVDLLWTHRRRERLSNQRTQLTNQVRGMLREYGIFLPEGIEVVKRSLRHLAEDADSGLTDRARQHLLESYEELSQLDERVKILDKQIVRECRTNETTKRLIGIRGVGPVIATAIYAFAGDAKQYSSSRQFSANLGLVPKEHSSGGKQSLGSITKRGNRYIRWVLVQGAWSIIKHVNSANDRLTRWARQLIERRGKQRTAVALANKLARIIWAMLRTQESYKAG